MTLFHQNTYKTTTTTTRTTTKIIEEEEEEAAPVPSPTEAAAAATAVAKKLVDIAFNTHAQRSTELISNGASIFIETSQSKKSCSPTKTTIIYSIHEILMKMRETINRIWADDGAFVRQRCCRLRRRESNNNKKSSIILMKIHLVLLIITLLTGASLCITRATAHTMKYSSNVVRTKYGELRGIVVRNNPTVEAYLGVPYATPPVGSLR